MNRLSFSFGARPLKLDLNFRENKYVVQLILTTDEQFN